MESHYKKGHNAFCNVSFLLLDAMNLVHYNNPVWTRFIASIINIASITINYRAVDAINRVPTNR